jgi:hypothetical protein
MEISKKIKKKAYEIAIAFNVPELRGSLRFNRRLDLLPAYPEFAALGMICRSTGLGSFTMGDVDRENLCRPSLATDLIDYRPSKSYVNQAPQKDD